MRRGEICIFSSKATIWGLILRLSGLPFPLIKGNYTKGVTRLMWTEGT